MYMYTACFMYMHVCIHHVHVQTDWSLVPTRLGYNALFALLVSTVWPQGSSI